MGAYEKVLSKIDIDRNGFVSSVELIKPITEVLGESWANYEIETIYSAIDEHVMNLLDAPFDKIRNKVQAIKTFVQNDLFFLDPLVFEKICLAVSEKYVDFTVVQDLDSVDICFSLRDLFSLYPFSNDLFDESVSAYIASQLKEEGFFVTPETVSFSQNFLDRLNYGMEDLEKLKKEVDVRLSSLKSLDELDENSVVDNQVLKILSIENAIKIKAGK